MNERIKEFEDQASQYASRETTDLDEWEFIFRKKFAELIVRECAKIVEDSTWNLPHGYKTVDQANLVKQHFGVKE